MTYRDDPATWTIEPEDPATKIGNLVRFSVGYLPYQDGGAASIHCDCGTAIKLSCRRDGEAILIPTTGECF